MSLNSKWFPSGTTEAEKLSLEQTIRHSKFTLDLLTNIIEREIEEKKKTKLGDYDSPGWPYRRADLDGQIRVLETILKLTKLERTIQ